MRGSTSELLDRNEELGVIDRQLDRARAGDGSLTVIEGPAGIGKTALLRTAMYRASEDGMTVLRGRGGVLERDLEFGVVRQLIEKTLLTSSPERRERLLSGPAKAAGLAVGIGDGTEDLGPGRDNLENVYHGLYWFMVNLSSEAPVLAVFDDLHWGDAESLAAGGYLSRRLDGLPIAMMAGIRTDEPESRAEAMTAVAAPDQVVHIRPAPLNSEAVAGVLTRAFRNQEVPPRLVEACREASGGNPFFLTELSFDLASAYPDLNRLDENKALEFGPLAVRRSLLLRLGSLGDEARALAWAVAILGGEGELRHAATIADLDFDTAAVAADALVAGGILEAGRPLQMAHPLVRAAVAEDIPDSRRSAAHRRAFEILREEGAGDDLLTVHALSSEPNGNPELVTLLRRTAARAMRSGAPSTAAVHLRRALSEPPPREERAEIVAALGRAEVRMGAFEDGMSHLSQAHADLDDDELRDGFLRDQMFAAFASGGLDRARELIKEALAGRDDTGGGRALVLEADLATIAWLSGVDHGLDLSRYLDVRGETRAERTMLALLAQEGQLSGMHSSQVIDLATRALAGGRLIEEDTSESFAWYLAVYVLIICESMEVAGETIRQAIADGRRRGSAFGTAGALGARAVLALNEGRPADAEADSLSVAEGPTPPIFRDVNTSTTIRALVDQGKIDEAEKVMIDGGIEFGPGGPTVFRWTTWSRAVLHEAQGDFEAVRVDVAPLIEDDKANRSMKALWWRALLARTLSRSGYSEEAERLATEHLEWAEGWGRPAALGVAQRAMALAGDPSLRTERMREAVETLSSSALRTEEAKAWVDLGISLLRAGSRRDGREALESGLELALACKARGLATVANQELEISGASPKRLSFDELTASERRVAEYAAAGSTNREIAEDLFVTPKTIENHLTRVYAKLGVKSRRELAEAL
ncbi:MAG TPA: AAA family ATPase [Solirubrobacterales bacterium]|nr:AAA family ATPase [Solirubrobacterales bacterium]